MRHNVDDGEVVHTPVMWREALNFAAEAKGVDSNIIVDCTLGEGGHSKLLLQKDSDIKIIGFERDKDILEIARNRLKKFSDRTELINDNFSNISKYFSSSKEQLSVILYDFGISSYHFDKSGRGFSVNADESLDMRLDHDGKLNAKYIVNKFSEKELREIIWEYGEERWAKKIAKDICAARREKYIHTTGDLAGIILRSIPKRYHVKNIHPATRVFQAIRIRVNDELSSIEKSLNEAYKLLAPGGIIITISFHSLEDRIVKDKFRRLSKGCTCALEPKHCMCNSAPIVTILTKKPMIAGSDEVFNNKRARSAKLRACKKL